MKKTRIVLAVVILLAVSLVWTLSWAVPEIVNFQGRLTDSLGDPLEGTYDMNFYLYNVETGGSSVWDEGQNVNIQEGFYTVQLGMLNPLAVNLFDNDELYLEVRIYNTDTATWEILSPRQRLTSTAFAMKAGNADSLEGINSTSFALISQLSTGGSGVDVNWNNLTNVPAGFEDGVDNNSGGDITAVNAGTGLSGGGISGDVTLNADTSYLQRRVGSSCAAGSSIRTINADGTVGCETDDSGDITAVNAGTGLSGGGTSGDVTINIEVPFVLNGSESWSLISAYNSASDGAGLYGESSYYGIWGYSTGNDYAGVHGTSNAGSGIGVRGWTTGSSGVGVYGDASAIESAENYGGYFTAAGNQGIGVKGEATAIGAGVVNYGGHFTASGASGKGAYGINTASGNYGYLGHIVNGVYGKSYTSGGNGVYGHGYAGVFGESSSVWGSGVYGNAYGDVPAGNTNYGVKGQSSSLGGTGVYGYASTNSGITYGIRGKVDSPDGYAGFFEGDVRVINGNMEVPVLTITGGSDLSERFDIHGTKEALAPSPGLVVSIDPESPGDLMVSNKAYDRKVAGIISGAGGVKPGMLMGQKGTEADGSNPVALTGRVYCWADASQGVIEPGDLLTTSNTPGHAMKATDYGKAQGAIIGKAMTSLKEGKELVLVLVSLQ